MCSALPLLLQLACSSLVWLRVQVLGADGLLYQSIDDLLAVAQSLNPDIQQFEASCFTGWSCSSYMSFSAILSLWKCQIAVLSSALIEC